MNLVPNAPTRIAAATTLSLLLVVLWTLTHRYQGLAQDARIYAMQAIARINPPLTNDLYLQNTSQDRYTLFSPVYAAAIRIFGLTTAARLLTALFALWFLAAAGSFAQKLLDREEAWLAVGALILTVGTYGSYRVFHFSEDYLTARLAAEALIATALAVHIRGNSRAALLLSLGAMLVHPLMALPGVLLVILMEISPRKSLTLALAGIAMAGLLALSAVALPAIRRHVAVMDTEWLDVVRERSQFLFLQLWSLQDWAINIRPFASLALSAMVFTDTRVRSLCVAGALVGASGLGVAAIASMLGPVALLLQGQAWRWVWIPAFLGTVLMIPTAIRLWRNPNCGPFCALLLAASWTISEYYAPALSLAAAALFAARGYIAEGPAKFLRWAALALGMAMVVVIGAHFSSAPSTGDVTARTSYFQQARIVDALRLPLLILLLIAWRYLRTPKSPWIPAAACLTLLAACAILIPAAFNKIDSVGSPSEIALFIDWRRAISPVGNVYVADGHDASPFAWFTLQRPNYLSLDQSAGVVFSRATALEVRRRSEVLLPLMDEDWRLYSKNRAIQGSGAKTAPRHAPLTSQALIAMCNDPLLGYLVARENVGFDPVKHQHVGPLKDWNLYNCAHVRKAAATPDGVPSA